MLTPHNKYLHQTLDIAAEALHPNTGLTPFGAVIVKDGEILGIGHSTVVADHDPTAHAEINAIRAAAKKTGNHLLDGADLYVSAFPSPMCFFAAKWAHIQRIFTCAPVEYSDRVGFEDMQYYWELGNVPGEYSDISVIVSDDRQLNRRAENILTQWKELFDAGGF